MPKAGLKNGYKPLLWETPVLVSFDGDWLLLGCVLVLGAMPSACIQYV